MVGLQVAGYPVVLLVIVASVGNTLGTVVNWMLGRSAEGFRDRRWLPVSPEKLEAAEPVAIMVAHWR